MANCPYCGRPIRFVEVDWGTGGCWGHYDPTRVACVFCSDRQSCYAMTPSWDPTGAIGRGILVQLADGSIARRFGGEW